MINPICIQSLIPQLRVRRKWRQRVQLSLPNLYTVTLSVRVCGLDLQLRRLTQRAVQANGSLRWQGTRVMRTRLWAFVWARCRQLSRATIDYSQDARVMRVCVMKRVPRLAEQGAEAGLCKDVEATVGCALERSQMT